MRQPDLVLLHAPSVYDFRRKTVLYGPISDVIPSTPILEMYPIGFASIAEYLGRHGYNVRIVNIAAKMLDSHSFDAERFLAKLNPLAFGIDLHWLAHAQGSLEIAKILKAQHPNIQVIFGGLTATYYHEELMASHPEVDYVIRGDSAEGPLLRLLECIEGETYPEDVPNLSWRDAYNKVHVNPITYVPDTLDEFMIDFGKLVSSVLRYRDVSGYIPWKGWDDYPLTAVFMCRGCTNNCVMCGGSRFTFQKFYGRRKVAFKSPEKIAAEMADIEQYLHAPIFLVGDPRIGGIKYATSVFNEIKEAKIQNPIVVELFKPANRVYLKNIANASSSFNIQITPESHDEGIRKATRGYTFGNEALEKSIENALKLGCERFDVFFTMGLPTQDVSSVRETAQYCRKLVEPKDESIRVHPFMSPWSPFVDPGSLAFEQPNEFGFRIFLRSLEDHRSALERSSWKYWLNYETNWITREDLIEITYEMASELNDMKREYGLISDDDADRIALRIELSHDALKKIDQIESSSEANRDQLLSDLQESVDQANQAILCDKKELLWDYLAKIKRVKVIKSLLGIN